MIEDIIMRVDRLKSGTLIWIAAGFTDLRRGFKGLSSIVETVPEQTPGGLSGETMSGGGFQRVGKPAAPCEFTLGDGGQVGLLSGRSSRIVIAGERATRALRRGQPFDCPARAARVS
jgi:hypothetical protein